MTQPINDDRSLYDETRWLFALTFALLISHELDAMIREEWRLLPGFGSLDAGPAADVFNLVHVPLFTMIVMGVMSPRPYIQRMTSVAVEVFVIGHALAHAVLRRTAEYNFEAPVETITVYGAAALAAVHLATFRR